VPNSFLWIGLVVLWLFVLFPMLADRHPRIRRTTDAALATRVLHRGDDERAVKRNGPAVHDGYSDWDQAEDWMDDENDVDDSGALAPIESGYDADDFVPDRRGRGRFDPDADAVAAASRYSFRQRMVVGLAFVTVAAAVFGLVLTHALWVIAGLSAALLVGYLGYLRYQVRVEQEIRNRRLARLDHPEAPSRAARRPDAYRPAEDAAEDAAEYDDYDEYDDYAETHYAGVDHTAAYMPFDPDRGVVLEADDEDPMFEYLEPYDPLETPVQRPDDHNLRRAAGE
jgi:hypothetical protein